MEQKANEKITLGLVDLLRSPCAAEARDSHCQQKENEESSGRDCLEVETARENGYGINRGLWKSCLGKYAALALL
ncbi:hypothetical protein AOLI_G00167880 [Acnodon oligacanthus]